MENDWHIQVSMSFKRKLNGDSVLQLCIGTPSNLSPKNKARKLSKPQTLSSKLLINLI